MYERRFEMRISSLLAVAALATSVGALAVKAPAQAAPGDVVIVTAQSATGSSASRAVFVSCPAGMRVVGGGGYVWNGARRVHIMASTPVNPDWVVVTQWSVAAA